MKLRTSDWAAEEGSALKTKSRRAKIVCTIGPACDSEEMIVGSHALAAWMWRA